MVVLCCSQCRARLPVAPEKLGKTLFVCPSCAFPLDPASAIPDDAPALGPAYAPVPPPLPIKPSKPPAPRPAKPTRSESPDAAPTVSRAWLWGGIGAGVGALALVTGILYLTLGRGTPPEESAADLLEVLALGEVLTTKGGDIEARKKAALALARAGREARAAFPAMLEALTDEDESLRDLVRNALDEAGPPEKEDFPLVSLALRDEDPDVRAYAVAVLPTLGEDAWGEIDEVRNLSEDDDPHVSAAAKASLEIMEKDMLDALTSKVRTDSNPDSRTAAARELADLGGASRRAASSLAEALSDENDAVRVAARGALVQMGTDSVPVLAETLKGPVVRARRASLEALGEMEEDAVEAVPAIVDAAEDEAVAEQAQKVIVRFREFAVPVLAERVVHFHNNPRQNVYNNLLVRIGPQGLPALNNYISRRTDARKHFTTVINKIGPARPPAPVVAPKVGEGGRAYKDLLAQFQTWDRTRKGLVTRDDLRRIFRGNNRLADAFLRRVDRDGRGHIHRHDYERWAHNHARHLAREREARDKMRAAHDRLHKQVKESAKKHQSDAARSVHRLKEDARNKPKAPAAKPKPGDSKARGGHEREAALAALRAQRKKEQAKHNQAHADMMRKQRDVHRIHHKQGPHARHVTPKQHQPPRHRPSVQKPPQRKAPPPPRHAPMRRR